MVAGQRRCRRRDPERAFGKCLPSNELRYDEYGSMKALVMRWSALVTGSPLDHISLANPSSLYYVRSKRGTRPSTILRSDQRRSRMKQLLGIFSVFVLGLGSAGAAEPK